MIWAVEKPTIGGKRVPQCDVFVWEQVSAAPSRCREGLLQIFIKGPAYPTGQWITFGKLLASAETWDEMQTKLQAHRLAGKRVVLAPAGGQP